jgi:thiosulfate reductase cytochrome b subunit
MGVARLLAKGWVFFCVFAAAHAIARAARAGVPIPAAIEPATICVFLFGAMGVLFIAGYGLSSGHLLSRLKPLHFVPGFNEIVFVTFAILSFAVQIASPHPFGAGLNALETAIRFAVPGQRALEGSLARCGIDGGRAFASAASWLLAFIFLGSALSRLRLSAALVRLERKRRIEPLGPSGIALVQGFATVAGIQLLFVGSLYRLLPCAVLSGILGPVLAGAGPLMLAYLAAAALTNLLAINPES